MQEYMFMLLYLLISISIVGEIAKHDSLIGVRVSATVRIILLIFSFERDRISFLAIIYQIYTYFMIGIFVWSRFMSLDFLKAFFQDPNIAYTYGLRIQFFILGPLSMIDIGICCLTKRRKRTSLSAGYTLGGFGGTPLNYLEKKQIEILANVDNADGVLFDKVYGTDIDWSIIGSSCGIQDFQKVIMNPNLPQPSRSVYGKLNSERKIISAIFLSYRTKEEAQKIVNIFIRKGLSRDQTVQILQVKGEVRIIFME